MDDVLFWNHSNEASVSADGLVAILLVLLGSRSLLESLALRSAIQGSGFFSDPRCFAAAPREREPLRSLCCRCRSVYFCVRAISIIAYSLV